MWWIWCASKTSARCVGRKGFGRMRIGEGRLLVSPDLLVTLIVAACLWVFLWSLKGSWKQGNYMNLMHCFVGTLTFEQALRLTYWASWYDLIFVSTTQNWIGWSWVSMWATWTMMGPKPHETPSVYDSLSPLLGSNAPILGKHSAYSFSGNVFEGP